MNIGLVGIYQQGLAARREGGANPYFARSPEAQIWEAGYMDGKRRVKARDKNLFDGVRIDVSEAVHVETE